MALSVPPFISSAFKVPLIIALLNSASPLPLICQPALPVMKFSVSIVEAPPNVIPPSLIVAPVVNFTSV